MPRNQKEYHENFLEYSDFIIHHPNYAGLPIKRKKDGSYSFVCAKESVIGKQRLAWIKRKAVELGYHVDADDAKNAGLYARVMREIHPTKFTTCQICGRSLSIYYYYPNKPALKSISERFGREYSYIDHISDIWDDLADEGNSESEIADFFLKECGIREDCSGCSKEDIISKMEYACRVNGKAFLGPGAMSNAPDRFDGFHSYNRCCRKQEDRGRWDSNMGQYSQDRRAYEYWSDGNIRAANKFMRHSTFKDVSADHIGPSRSDLCMIPAISSR